MAIAIGGHHGRFPEISAIADARGSSLGGPAWKAARQNLVSLLAATLEVDLGPRVELGWSDAVMPLVVHLAGLITLADWIGSSEEDFPYASAGDSWQSYAQRSRERAKRAIGRIPFTRIQPPTAAEFEQVFPHCKPPRPLQLTMAAQLQAVEFPAMLLVEAPTGEGKTEAALYAVEAALRDGATGFYLAMPTQATSNQMHDRAEEYRRNRLPEAATPAILLHSAALLRLRSSTNDERQDDVGTAAWFYGRKRGLLTPLGVGTIDQSLLATMRTKHWFLRLCGLTSKVIVFDEVHAYDTYTSALLQRLLRWLGTVGSTVVLLSATLPAAKRKELVEAYRGEPVDIGAVPYPRLTVASRRSVAEIPFEAAADRRVRISLEWLRDAELAGLVRSRLSEDGGCIAVIRNRVQAAQETYRSLAASLADTETEVVLFHSRFPFQWRLEIEGVLKRRLGRSGTDRPKNMVVVATQVIEQSLDLDFDWLVTDIAPTDLILQRVGRLHRHRRTRPAGFSAPQLTLLESQLDEAGLPSFGRDEYVYDRSILLRSWAILTQSDTLLLPDEVERLVEQTYAARFTIEISDAFQSSLETAEEAFREDSRQHEAVAARSAIPTPSLEPFSWADLDLQDDEDPRLHQDVRAATRLGPPSVSVCCTKGGYLVTDTGVKAIPDGIVDNAFANKVLSASLPLAHERLVRYLANQAPPPQWRAHPLLRFQRLLDFDEGGTAIVNGLRLRISRDEGLTIDNEVEELP